MTTIVAIMESDSTPGGFMLATTVSKDKVVFTELNSRDPKVAAESAITEAQRIGPPYVIFAPESLLEHIPRDMRSKGKH